MPRKPEMKCPKCRMWIPAGSQWQVNVPSHDARRGRETIHCTGSGRAPTDTRGFRSE